MHQHLGEPEEVVVVEAVGGDICGSCARRCWRCAGWFGAGFLLWLGSSDTESESAEDSAGAATVR